MILNKIKWKIYFNKNEDTEYISEFITKLLKNKRNVFLTLKFEIKSDYVKITGYFLHLLSDNDDNCVLWLYLYNNIDVFLQTIFNDKINEIENFSNVFYINCFGRFMSSY